MSEDNSGGSRSTQSAMLERNAPARPPEVEQHMTETETSDDSTPLSDLSAEPTSGASGDELVVDEAVVPLVDVEVGGAADEPDSSGAPIDRLAARKPVRATRRQLVGQILFGLALGSVMFFLFGKSGDEVVDATVSDVDTTVRFDTAPANESRSNNFGIGDLAVESRPALPRSDLPGATSTTLGPLQQAPSTIVVGVTDGDEDVDPDAVDVYQDEFVPFDPDNDIPFTTDPVSADTTAPTTTDFETTYVPSVVTTTSLDTEPTGSATSIPTGASGGDGQAGSTTTSLVESTTVPVEVEVSIVGVVDGGTSGLQLSASPDVDDYTYCWAVGYETSGESSRFCADEANTSSDGVSVLGNATVVLEIYTFEGELVGTDTVTLELLTQSVLRLPVDSDMVSLVDRLKVRSAARPELTQYCWNVIQGDISVLKCGDENVGRIDVEGQGFQVGPGSIRGQVYIGPEGSRRLVGSEEILVNFE